MNRTVAAALVPRRWYAMEGIKESQSKFMQARKRRNFLILGTLVGFIGGVYYYVILRVGQDAFQDVDKQGNPRVKV